MTSILILIGVGFLSVYCYDIWWKHHGRHIKEEDDRLFSRRTSSRRRK